MAAGLSAHFKVTNVVNTPSGKIAQITLQPVNDPSVTSPMYTFNTPNGNLVLDCVEANQNTPPGSPTNVFLFNAAAIASMTVGSDIFIDISATLI
ncbi:MAG: hypothetical protein ABR999_10770 [Methanoregula sp.]|jgi:hypothetical protein|uniref:hypothetical protein n=1 Tax=Methanoregula sp. TaxID=2052170 RepID=UPI003D14E382